MTKKKKSILEETILDAQRIQEALKANTKEILRSVSREEIDEIIKESLEESEYVEEDVVTEDDDEIEDDAEDMDDMDDVDDESGEEAGEEDMEIADDEVEGDFEGDGDNGEDMEGGEDYEDMDSGVEVEPMGDMEMSDDEEEVMDMTGSSDDDVISVFKKLSGEDEIEVVGDEIILNVTEPGEYVIKTGNGAPAPAEMEPMGEPEMDASMGEPMGEPEMDASMGEPMGEPEMDASMGDEEMGDEEMGGEEMGEPEMDDSMGGEEMGDEYAEDEEEVVYEIALDEEIIRSATSDIEKSMTGDLPDGDIEGQTAPLDNDTSGDNLEGGFEDDKAHGKGEGQMVMKEEDVNEDDEVNEDDDINEEDVAEGDEIEENLMGRNGKGPKNVGAAMEGRNKGAFNESTAKYKKMVTESKNLKKENEEFKKSLKTFRGMLAETVVFNSNLTYVTKLFMEHSTTRGEKKTILKRFDDEVSTIKESKKLYKAISNDLKGRTPINESVKSKMDRRGSSSASNLNETTAYVDQSTTRINDLIKRVEQR